MSQRHEPVTIRRILVAVDASSHSQAALEAAIEMARRFNAELVGLFVEDLNVLRAAGLPLAQAFGEYSAARQRIDIHSVERQFRWRIRRTRRIFVQLTRQQSVRASFRVARGMVNAEIHAAAETADVLIIGRAGWSRARHRQLGSTARAICGDEIPGVTAILKEGQQLTGPVTVLYDGSREGDQALLVAGALVEEVSEPLQILLVAADAEHARQLRARANRCLRSASTMRQYRSVVKPRVAQLARRVQETQAGAVVVPANLSLIQEDSLPELLGVIDLPIVLVR